MAIAHTEQENRRATMKDVARRAGVTIGTVSHVINGTAPISEETTARVREAIRELNYVPNLAARHMRRKEKRQIGLLIPKLNNNFYARIASVLMEDAYQEDYTVLMLSYEYSSEKEKRGLVNMVQNDTETIVIVNGEDDENSIRKLVASGVHVILADRRSTIPGTETKLTPETEAPTMPNATMYHGDLRFPRKKVSLSEEPADSLPKA